MNKSLLPAIAAVAALLCPMALHAADSVPNWVKEAAAESPGTYPADTPAVVLLDEQTLTVQGAGKITNHVRQVIRILRPAGREYATFDFPFDKLRKISNMHVWSIGADGHEHQLKDADLVNRSPLQGIIFDDVQYRSGTAPAAEPGAVVAVEADLQERPYMAEDVWAFQTRIPLRHGRYTLQVPSGYEYRAVWAHHGPVEPAQLAPFQWRWTMNDVPGIDLHRTWLAPSVGALAGRMSVQWSGPGMDVAFHGDWKSVGAWESHLTEGRFTPTPEIVAKTEEITRGKTDFYGKTTAIADYVQQNIRYFGVEIGVGGFQPHPAAEVFQHQYGDCKDKATLFVSMLRAAGLNGVVLGVDDRRGVIDPAAPSILGNHMIAAAEVPPGTDVSRLKSLITTNNGKHYVVFDPTQQYIPFGQLPYYEQGGYGIVVNGENSQIVQFPVEAPADSVRSRSAHFKLLADGSVSGTVTEDVDGNYAVWERQQLLTMDAAQRDRWLDLKLKQDLANYQLVSFTVDHVQDLSHDLEMHYDMTAPHYSKSMGPLLLLRPRVLGDDVPEIDEDEVRNVPVDLDIAGVRKDDYSIDLPAGYTVDELPDPVNLDLGFAAYESSTKLEGNTLHYTRTLTTRQVQISADKYQELRTLAAVIHKDQQGSAVLKRVQ